MSYLNVIADGVLAKRQAVAMQEFDYEAFNVQQAALADQQEHYREVREQKAKRAATTKKNQARKLNKEYDALMDSWMKEKTFDVFCRMEEIEETLVKILG
jgi:hypothetical protein